MGDRQRLASPARQSDGQRRSGCLSMVALEASDTGTVGLGRDSLYLAFVDSGPAASPLPLCGEA
jgi:hypothetical protein